MNLYEHTIVARQDISPSQIKQITEKYSKIVEKNDGDIIKTQNWGLLNLSYIIKKNKKGNYIHFKFKGSGKIIEELEKAAKEGKGAAQLDGRMIDAASARMAENIVNIDKLIHNK